MKNLLFVILILSSFLTNAQKEPQAYIECFVDNDSVGTLSRILTFKIFETSEGHLLEVCSVESGCFSSSRKSLGQELVDIEEAFDGEVLFITQLNDVDNNQLKIIIDKNQKLAPSEYQREDRDYYDARINMFLGSKNFDDEPLECSIQK